MYVYYLFNLFSPKHTLSIPMKAYPGFSFLNKSWLGTHYLHAQPQYVSLLLLCKVRLLPIICLSIKIKLQNKSHETLNTLAGFEPILF
jgi:hypothetical protein